MRLTGHEGIGWLHVFTGDTIAGREREALAVEPTTAPPDAFNSGVDLVVLEPGATHRASFTGSLEADEPHLRPDRRARARGCIRRTSSS